MRMKDINASIGILICILVGITSTNGAAVMSIDLGSEWMKVGVVSPGVPMEIALNKESKRKTPAIIAFRDGSRIFGEDAQTIGLRFPAQSYVYLLDLLGKTIDNPMVDLYRKRFPYYNIEADPNRNTVVFKSGDDTFTVEELIAQMIQKAREFAEDSTGQQITECVLIVPGFFGQAERNALLTAGNLANIKVLQLINDYTAVALNYGLFRRQEINETAQYFIFYDMGAHKTSAAVVSYQLVKDKVTRETNPVIQILGVGYDRTLGGLEMQLRLRDYLAKEFNGMKKTKTDVFSNPRAMAKLLKEAGRVKNVLSANSDHYAQIEGLLDDIDFKFQVTREKFEELCKDLFDRVSFPLDQALKTSGLTLDVMKQVILFGGGTRVPRVQDILRERIGQELGKNLNMDEAATMGAVFKAADLATGFKVKKFITKDAVLFPIQVVFDRENESGNTKLIKRNLFTSMNSYPQKKVITFNKHTDDFTFNVNYADLDYLSSQEISYIGKLNLSQISLSNVAQILEANQGEGVESKGIKAHFVLDDSGVFMLTGTELVLEKTVKVAAEEEGTLSKLSSTISKLFGSEKDDEGTVKVEVIEEKPEKNETKTNGTTSDNSTVNSNTTESVSNKTDVPKTVVVKEPVPFKVETLFTIPLDGDSLKEARSKIDRLEEVEQQLVRRESALNALESFVIEARQKLSEDEYSSCAKESESDAVLKACNDISDWLYEDGSEADADTYEKKLSNLKLLSNDIYARHWEHSERPEALKTLEKIINGSQHFLDHARNYTKDVNPDKDVFTLVEIEILEKTIAETIDWRDTEVGAQNKLKRNDEVRLTIKNLSDKMGTLDREVKYLVNKLKIWKPKLKDTPKKKDKVNETDESNGTITEEMVEESDDSEMTEQEQIDFPELLEENIESTEESDKETQTPHSEL